MTLSRAIPQFETYLATPHSRCIVYDDDFSLDDAETIEMQLREIRSHYDGVILYGVGPQAHFVLERLVETHYQAAMVTVWDPRSNTELEQTAQLVRDFGGQLAIAVSIGTEGLLEGRYKAEDLSSAREKLLEMIGPAAKRPALTTSEPWWKYTRSDEDAVVLRRFGDFACPIVHVIWDAPEIADASNAADWTLQRAKDVAGATGMTVLVRESGFPGGGTPPHPEARLKQFTRTLQMDYWRAMDNRERIAAGSRVKVAVFEATDNRRKIWSDFEGSWGVRPGS